MLALLAVTASLGVMSSRAEPFLDGLSAYETKDYGKAKVLLQTAADEGNDYAQAYLAHMAYDESEGTSDPANAVELYKKAAKAGNAAGEFGLALIYDDDKVEPGKSHRYNHEQSLEHLRRAARSGFLVAKLNLASTILNEGPKSEIPQAVQFLRDVIDGGGGAAPWAMRDLAKCYADGLGVPSDEQERVKWDRKSAVLLGDDKRLEQVDDHARNPGVFLPDFPISVLRWDFGGETGRDETLAWLNRDARAGRASAQYLVGAAAEEGIGGRKDVKAAVEWYKKAAAQGYEPAQKRLAALLPPEPKPQPAAAAAAAAAAPASYSSEVDKAPFQLKERPQDFAFIVGVEKYKNIPEARFAERDAAAFRAHALALGVPQRNVISLSGEGATRSKIQAYLDEWLPKNVKEDSTLFVYYSGHGAPDAETRQAYLLPWDADPQFLQSTAYALKDVYAALNRLKAKRVIVALDSCFSGAGGRSVIAPGLRPLVTKIDPMQDPGRLVIFSAASGEQVTGSLDDQGHGIFTYYFLKALAAEAKGSGDGLTANSIYFYLKPRVEDASARQNRVQTPQLAGGGDAALLDLK